MKEGLDNVRNKIQALTAKVFFGISTFIQMMSCPGNSKQATLCAINWLDSIHRYKLLLKIIVVSPVQLIMYMVSYITAILFVRTQQKRRVFIPFGQATK